MMLSSGVVADTHAFVWYLRDDPQLSTSAGEVLDRVTAAGHPIVISAITRVELCYLTEKGTLDEIVLSAVDTLLAQPNSPFDTAPVDATVAAAVGRIPRAAVRDPWDRIIAATSMVLGLPLVTKDRKLQALDVLTTVW